MADLNESMEFLGYMTARQHEAFIKIAGEAYIVKKLTEISKEKEDNE